MKKIALATLLAATTFVASAQVSISGKIGQFADSTKTGDVRVGSMVAEPTNNIAVTATEDLGSGLKARVVLNTSLGSNTIDSTGTRIGDRQGTVGLASNFGSVDLGRNTHTEWASIINNDVFNGFYGTVATSVHTLRGSRISNGVFATVNPVKGLTVSYDRSQVATGTDATSFGAVATVAGVRVTAARFEQGAETSTVVGLNTTIAGTRITYTHSDDKGVATSKGDLIGVAKPFGAYTAKASYGRTNQDVKAYAVGLDYALSKRTDLSVSYRNVDKTGTSQDVTGAGIGMIHRF